MQLNIYHADDKATYCLVLYINNNLFSEEYVDKAESDMKDKPRV
jgi:hypothetical protein